MIRKIYRSYGLFKIINVIATNISAPMELLSTWLVLLNKIQNAEVSDTTGADSSNEVGKQKIF